MAMAFPVFAIPWRLMLFQDDALAQTTGYLLLTDNNDGGQDTFTQNEKKTTKTLNGVAIDPTCINIVRDLNARKQSNAF